MVKIPNVVVLFAANASGQSVSLERQIVCCAECWAEADRTKVEFGTNWLEFIGKRAAVTGTVEKKKNTSVLRIDTFEVLAPSLAEREAANVIGKEIELTLKDPFGTDQRLSALKGRIVILNFWATYCIPCRKEMPDLAAIQNEYAALGVQVIGASESLTRLIVRRGETRSRTGLGITIAALSLVVMPYLANAKRKVAAALQSRALQVDSRQTDICAYLSAILLGGLLLNALFGWWWADPVAGLVMVPIIAREGINAFRGETCCDERVCT